MPPAVPTHLRRAIERLLHHATDPAVLLSTADALDEAAREAALSGRPDPDLPDLATLARHRAAFLPATAGAPGCRA